MAAIAWGLASGRAAALSEGALGAVMDAVSLALRLAGGFALWNGLLAILEKSGAIRGLCRLLSPALSWLFPALRKEDPAREAISLNLSANLLGLGNAATPSGLRAMRLLADGTGRATDTMCMFLVLNASALQLFPSTVVALRAAAGSAAPASVVLPTLLSTLVSTAVGLTACRLLQGRGNRSG